jgi:hypothetical protein
MLLDHFEKLVSQYVAHSEMKRCNPRVNLIAIIMTFFASHGGSSFGSIISSTNSIDMGNMFSQFNPILVLNNPQKVVKKLHIFEYEVYVNATLWHTFYPLNIALTIDPLPKFKDHILKFSRDGVTSLGIFSNTKRGGESILSNFYHFKPKHTM